TGAADDGAGGCTTGGLKVVVIPGWPKAGPGIHTHGGGMDSGLVLRTPRNDGGWSGPYDPSPGSISMPLRRAQARAQPMTLPPMVNSIPIAFDLKLKSLP